MEADTARRFFVGCYTDGSGGIAGAGITRCLLDTDSGALHLLGGVQEVVKPSYLAVGARRDVLYAVQETSDTPSVHALPGTVAFLMSDDASYITGVNIPIAGGIL